MHFIEAQPHSAASNEPSWRLKIGKIMRFIFAGILSSLLLTNFCNAGELRTVIPEQRDVGEIDTNEQSYRGYHFDLSKFAGRPDLAKLSDTVRGQVDLVENVGLSQHVLGFFRTVPIIGNELACLESEVHSVACYATRIVSQLEPTENLSVWDSKSASWTISNPVRPLVPAVRDHAVYLHPSIKFEPKEPVVLHEMLHAFHDQVLPDGNGNKGVLFYYGSAKSKQLYPADAYLMRNQMEFFAVTASIFLYGKDSANEPFKRATLKEKQPDYYRYLVSLFEFDPDRAATGIPVASATLQDITGLKSTSEILPGMSAASR